MILTTRAAAALRAFRRKLRTVPRCPFVYDGLQCTLPRDHPGTTGLFADTALGHRLDVDDRGYTDSRRWHARVPGPWG